MVTESSDITHDKPIQGISCVWLARMRSNQSPSACGASSALPCKSAFLISGTLQHLVIVTVPDDRVAILEHLIIVTVPDERVAILEHLVIVTVPDERVAILEHLVIIIVPVPDERVAILEHLVIITVPDERVAILEHLVIITVPGGYLRAPGHRNST